MKCVSCDCQLKGTSATITPVRPPSTKMKKKPRMKRIGGVSRGWPDHSVAIQAKTCTPMGIATAIDAAEKKLMASSGMPVANMWCTHSPKLRKPVPMMASTIQVYPTTGRRANTGISVDTTPAAGRKMMYTSGWPNNQNKCCHSSGEPPSSTSKNTNPKARSISSSTLPRISGGKPNAIMNAVTSTYQANSGMRWIDMPGARVRRIATISSIAPVTAAISEKVTPSSQKSGPSPGEYSLPLSGVYMNQPASGAAPNRKPEYRNNPPNR